MAVNSQSYFEYFVIDTIHYYIILVKLLEQSGMCYKVVWKT